ncbi:MAG: protein kinase [Prosthecobacter sp.]|jgi:serine/threonine protein kinase/WD40 repeat protein|uniref:WD40 repeat domain-containing serine/threonine protein kinase n=1 Tax=Prosthecobacter sp. TaxID=1965333 RepID=UPI0019EEA88E|nr:serine/threonine-protein kinase [Prosthecobacter sp.]MBE2284923.1 protein kinase [Prosthecobacter sp.]
MKSPETNEDTSLGDFIRAAVKDHDQGRSHEQDAPTVIENAPRRGARLGVLPGHEVRDFIARGGMGAVYLARQQALEREVAVKVMTRDAGSAEMAERFRREALVLGRLAHPNIVPVYDIGTDDEGQLFYTMKLVKGRTLQHILNDLRTEDAAVLKEHTLASLLTVFRKVCDALAFAHSQGIIHRDLKPENVMVGEFGEVLVMDWGLAKKIGEKADAGELSPSSMMIRKADFGGTLAGSVMGTPQYMSPEQAMGLVDELDARSDIFSLGGILYAILTLRPPVEGTTLEEVLNKVRTGNIASPSAYGATAGEGKVQAKGTVLEARKITPLPHIEGGKVPVALSAVVMKALVLDKTRRYQTVAAFSADIEAFQGGFATTAEQAGLAKQLVLLIRRHRGIFTTAAAAWLIITALAMWFVFHLREKEQRAIAGEEAAIVEKEAARKSAATANLNVADAALREGNSAAMQAALDAVPEDLRDSTWGYLLDQSDTSIARIRSSGTNDIEGVAADPRRPGVFAVADRHRHITVLEVRTGMRLLEFKAAFSETDPRDQFRLAFSPDGERIAVGRSGAGEIVIHSAKDGQKLAGWPAPAASWLKFSADGGRLLQRTAGAKSHVMMWDSAKGDILWKYAPTRGAGFADFTPDGQQVVTIGKGEALRLVSAQDGTLVRDIAPGVESSMTALSLGGSDLLAVADEMRAIKVLNWRDGRVITRFQCEVSGPRMINDLVWTPDGTQLITALEGTDGRQMIRVWDARTGAMLRSLLGGSLGVHCLDLHPLSGELLVTGLASRAWSLTGARAAWTLPQAGITSMAFWGADDVILASPPPGSVVAVAAQKLLPDGGSKLLWKPVNLGYRNPIVSPDGQWAAVTYPRGKSTVLLRRKGDEIDPVLTLNTPHQADHVRFSPTGATLAAYNFSELELFSTATGKPLPKLEREGIRYFADLTWISKERLVGLVIAHARRLEAGSEEWVVLWDTRTGKILQTTKHDSALNVLAAAPDGSRFAEAGVDKKVRIRDAVTLAVQQEFRAHDGPLTALAWHPSRGILATASTDLSIRLWDLATGRRLEELRGPTRPPHQLSFSPSGHLIGAASTGDPTPIWQPESLKETNEAQQPVNK